MAIQIIDDVPSRRCFYDDDGILFKIIYSDGTIEYRVIGECGYTQIIQISGNQLTVLTKSTKMKFIDGVLVERMDCAGQMFDVTFCMKPPI